MKDLKIIRGRIVTFQNGPVSGARMDSPLVLEDTNIIIDDGHIDSIGSDAPTRESIDARGKLVIPGFIDCHTHLVFAGSREDEFVKRLKGKSYKDIADEGGGILSTVKATREADKETLVRLARIRLQIALSWGTTTVEIKSGYGLSTNDEIKMLEVIEELRYTSTQTIVPTFLGAHEFPVEMARDEYLSLLINTMIPEVSRRGLARYIDVFCEEGVYTKDESKMLLLKGRELGLLPKIHADELTSSGGSEIARDVRAVTCEHLSYPSEEGIKSIKDAGTIAVLLPATTFFLSGKPAPAKRFLDENIPFAIASDFNPGSSPVIAMPVIIGLACILYRITPAQALCASTINASYALGEEDRGSIEIGKKADILICRYKNENELPYWFGFNPVDFIIKEGKLQKNLDNNAKICYT